MILKNIHIFWLVALAALISSCDSKVVFEKYKPIPGQKWNKDSLVVIDVPVNDTLQNHNILIDIRNNVTYNYSNLWLFIEIVQPDGEAMKDTFELTLANPSGKWLGEGFGSIKTRQVIFLRNVYFPVSGEYKFKFQQGMREKTLEGIHDVGLRIEKAGS